MPDPSPADEAARLLEAKPHSVRAHALLGGQHAGKGDEQTATYYYRRALYLAEMQDLDDADVVHARAALARLEAEADSRRESRLTGRGLPPSKRAARPAGALQNPAARRPPTVQEAS